MKTLKSIVTKKVTLCFNKLREENLKVAAFVKFPTSVMVFFEIHQRLKGPFLNELRVSFNLFLIDYAYCKLCNILLLLFENNSRSYHYAGASHWRKSIVAVTTQDR